ncbi:hypothetical protein BGZ99_000232 [Dissophora globulifera]|uniref:Uncharacterized protein n=1 Tax=Dissophora globulifera TaxID=979702 RepID=A0A9P6UKM4_9FUNG|nr:hypothetical protein BGZ99_000232 [Dissophora globulifera]
MAMTEQAVNSYFQTTHARVDSKLHSDSSSDKVDDMTYASLARPVSSGLRRCAATRDLTSIRSSVNYCARVYVEYMIGDASTPFHTPTWRQLAVPEGTSKTVLVDNLETVRRFKKTLYTQLCPDAEGSENSWPELSLFRKRDGCVASSSGFEPIDGDQEALYMFALKDGDQVVLLVHENSGNSNSNSAGGNNGCSGSPADPVTLWVEAIRAQTEFEAVDS